LEIDSVRYKGYLNAIQISVGTDTEIKHFEGEVQLNLAPIAGYSMITQELNVSYINNKYVVTSKIYPFYNSVSNREYVDQTPVITVIQVNGDTVINHEVNTVYSDAGATYTDDFDDDLTIITSDHDFDVSILQSNIVTYSVTDSDGNTGTATRLVNVIDATNPVVVITSEEIITIFKDSAYFEEGATASDNSNETLTVTIGGDVDTSIIADYELTYTATDSSGNVHNLSRLVKVIQDEPGVVWTNDSVNIFSLTNLGNRFKALAFTDPNAPTRIPLAISNFSEEYLNGDYMIEGSSQYSFASHALTMFNVSSARWSSSKAPEFSMNHHEFGSNTELQSISYNCITI
jgi:hypothetical protein